MRVADQGDVGGLGGDVVAGAAAGPAALAEESRLYCPRVPRKYGYNPRLIRANLARPCGGSVSEEHLVVEHERRLQPRRARVAWRVTGGEQAEEGEEGADTQRLRGAEHAEVTSRSQPKETAQRRRGTGFSPVGAVASRHTGSAPMMALPQVRVVVERQRRILLRQRPRRRRRGVLTR